MKCSNNLNCVLGVRPEVLPHGRPDAADETYEASESFFASDYNDGSIRIDLRRSMRRRDDDIRSQSREEAA